MANVYKGLTVQFGGDTSELQKALKQATSAASDTQSQLKKLNNDLKFDDDNVIALKQKFGLLEDAIGDAAIKLQLYNTTAKQLGDTVVTIKGVTTTVEQLAEETENVGLATSEALAAYNNIDAALENVNVQLSKMEKELIDSGEASNNTYIAVNKMSKVQFDTLISDLKKAGDLTEENAQAIYGLKKQYNTLANENDVYKMVDQFENLKVSALDSETQVERLRVQLTEMDVDSISDLSVNFDEAARNIKTSAQAIDTMDTSVSDYQSAIQQLDTKMKSHGTTTDDLTLKYQLLSEETTALRTKQKALESTFGIDEDVIQSIMDATSQLEYLTVAAQRGNISVEGLQDAFGTTSDKAEELYSLISKWDMDDFTLALGDGSSSLEELALKAGLVDESMESSVATYVALTKKTEDLHQEMLFASDAYAQAKGYVDQLTNELETEERALDSLNSELAITEAKLSSGVFDEENGENVESLTKKVEELKQKISDQNNAIAETSTGIADAQDAAETAEAVFNDAKVAESIGSVRDEVLGLDEDIAGVGETESATAQQIIAEIEKQQEENEKLVESINDHAKMISNVEASYKSASDAMDEWESKVDDEMVSGLEQLYDTVLKVEQAISSAFDADYARDFILEMDNIATAVQSLQTELSKVDAALQLDPTNPELLATKMRLLAEETRALKTEADSTEAAFTNLGNTSATLGGVEETVADLSERTNDAATDAAEAKSRYNELTTQLEAMCGPITEAVHLTGDLEDEFDLFSTMGTSSTEEIISSFTEMGYITEEQADKLREVSDAWATAKNDMDATEQVQQYKQLGIQLQTLKADASDAADQLAQMKLNEQLESNVSDTSERVNILSNRLDETATSLTQVNKKFAFDSSNVQTAAERIQLLNKYAGTASEKMSVLKKRISELESSGIEASEKSMYELSKEADEAADNFKTAAKRVQELDDALQDAKKKAEGLTDSADDVEGEYKEAKEQVEKYNDALQDAKKAQDEAADALQNAEMAKEWKELKNELDDTEAALEDVKEEAQQTNEKVSGIKETGTTSFSSIMYAIEDAGQAIEQFGSQMQSAFESAIESADEVSEAFTNMKKTTEGTEEEFDELLDSAKEMSTTSAVSADTILEIEELGGALGIAADDLDGFAETISNLSIATDLEADEAAEEVGSLMNILDDLDTSNLDEFSDALVRLGNNGASTESDIVDIAERIAAVGSQAGMSTPEILAWASTIASTGSEAESAGTAISNTMSDIETAVANGGEELELFAEIAGMSADEFATAWETDPSTAMQAFIEGLANMEDSGESSITALEELGITSVRQVTNIENLASSIGLLDDNLTMANDAWNGVSDEWGDAGDAANEAEQASEGLSGTLTILQNSLQVLGTEVGEALEPMLQDLVGIIQNVTDAVANSDGEFIQFLAGLTAVSVVGGGFIEIASSLANGVDKLSSIFKSTSKSSKTVTTTFTKMSSATGTASGETETLVATMNDAAASTSSLSSTLKKGLVAVGITAALAAIGMLIEKYKDLSDITDEAKKNDEDFADAEAELADAFDITSDAASGASDSYDDVLEYQEDLIERTEDLADTFEDSYDDMFDSIADMSEAKSVLEDFANGTGDFTESTNISASALEDLKEAVELYNEKLGTSYTVMEQSDGSFAIVDEAADGTEDAIHDVTEEILGLADDAMWDEVLDAVATNMDELKSEINDNSVAVMEIQMEIDENEYEISQLFDKYIDAAEEAGNDAAVDFYESWEEKIEESGYDSDVIAGFYTAMLNSAELTGGSIWTEEDYEGLVNYSDELNALILEQEEYADSTDLMSEELVRLQNVYNSIENGTASEALTNLMEESGESFEAIVIGAESAIEGGTEIFAQTLEDCGVSVDKFTELSSTDMATFFSSWDGTVGNLKVLLAEYGLTLDETQQQSQSLFDEFGYNLASSTATTDQQLSVLMALFSEDFDMVQAMADEYGVTIPEGLIEGLEDGTYSVDEAAFTMLNSMMDSMSQADLYDLAVGMGAEIPEGVTEALADGEGLTEDQTAALADAIIEAFCTKMGISSPSDEMITLGDYVIQGLLEGMSDTSTIAAATQEMAQVIIDTAEESLSSFGTDVINAMFNSGENGSLTQQMTDAGAEMSLGLATGISANTTAVDNAITALMSAAESGIGENFMLTMENKGRAGVNSFVGAIEAGADDAASAAETLGAGVYADGLGESFQTGMEDAGKIGANSFAAGVTSATSLSAAKSAGETIAAKAIAGANAKVTAATTAGVNFAKGYALGITSMSGYVYTKAYNMAAKAVQAANDAQDSGSPSKVMREVGEWYGEGYVEGIVSEYGDIEKAAAKAAAVAIEAASTDAVASINYETAAQAATASAVLDALDRLDTNTSNNENAGTVVNQTFQTKVVRSDSDLYTAAPIIYRNAMREAALV